MSTSVLPPEHERTSSSAQGSTTATWSADKSEQTRLLHLHSYFMFPFAINKAAVLDANGKFWPAGSEWLTGLDEWIASVTSQSRRTLGGWWRAAYDRFDLS